MADSSRNKSTIYVGGLDHAVTVQTLHDTFIAFGEIADISLPKPDQPNAVEPHRGFGYVEFELPEDALEAVDNMDQSELYGRVIKVATAKPQKDPNEGIGSRTALWQQEGYLAKYGATDEAAEHEGDENAPADPMQGLEQLDVAGPRAQ